jgi:hypothetical protein
MNCTVVAAVNTKVSIDIENVMLKAYADGLTIAHYEWKIFSSQLKGKDKVVPAHAMKMYRGSRSIV